MLAYVALQVRAANDVRIENAIGDEQRNFRVVCAIFTEYIDREQQHVGVELLHAPPDQTETPERLVARERIAGGGLHIFHVAAENRWQKPGEKLRDRTAQVLLIAQHIRRTLRGLRL